MHSCTNDDTVDVDEMNVHDMDGVLNIPVAFIGLTGVDTGVHLDGENVCLINVKSRLEN